MFSKVIILLSLFVVHSLGNTEESGQSEQSGQSGQSDLSEAPWNECSAQDLLNPIASQNVQIFISGCSRNETECQLHRGSNHTITAKFTPSGTYTGIERYIVAKFPRMLRGRPVEVPYGGIVNACPSTIRDSDGTNCETNGIIANTEYTHETVFPVFSSAPRTSLVVRYMIRAPDTLARSSRGRRRNDWRSHRQPYFVCAEIPVRLV